ncbi:helix-turn-helix domain-containing protein [Streptomyces cadmiisoli]|uniref:helix-turn-helix domain-containing protein n=1 Tax=Streptomyces cadmiisoli TaxID=2184053 RepID=UPI0036482A44
MNTTRVEHFTLDGVPPKEREQRWQEVVSATHFDTRVRLSPDHPGQAFRASARRVHVDDLALVDTRCDPCTGVRSRGRIQDGGADHVIVVFTRAGRETVAQDGNTRELLPGGGAVWDSASATRFQVWEPLVKRSLVVPRSALREVGGPRGPVRGVLDQAEPATKLLADYLDVLARTAEELSPAAVASARTAALHLVSAALHADRGRPGPVAAGSVPLPLPVPLRRAAVVRWIESNLNRPDLTPALVAQGHGLSVRTLHRLFEESGETVAGFVRTRRLARARADLTAGEEPVSVIASRWGFADPSHFTRAFGEAYGTTPTRYRADARTRPGTRVGADGADTRVPSVGAERPAPGTQRQAVPYDGGQDRGTRPM